MLELSGFEEFYARNRSLVFATALRVLHNPSEAEDVAQTVFLKAWVNPNAFHGGNIESWLTTLAKNCAIDVIRKRRREPVVSLELLRFTPAVHDVEEEVIGSLRARGVCNAVRGLRSDQRECVVASFFGGQTHERIARAKALPLGTVKTRIRSGLMQLRKEAAL